MTPPPRVSIILPTYNRADRLPRAIESVLAQTFTDWELIGVDDHSPDATPEVLAEYASKDPRIRVVRNEVNKKLPATLNAGFRLARGEFWTWTSDDNLFRPNAIQRMVETLQTHPEVGLLYCDYSVIDAEDRVVDAFPVRPPEDLAHASIVGACFMYPRAVAQAVGEYDESLFLAEDYDYWVRIAKRYPLMPLHEDLYLYRTHGGSLTWTYPERVLKAVNFVIERHLNDPGWIPSGQKGAIRMQLAVAAYWLRDIEGLRRHLPGAFKAQPTHVLRHFKRGLIAAVRGRAYLERVVAETGPTLGPWWMRGEPPVAARIDGSLSS